MVASGITVQLWITPPLKEPAYSIVSIPSLGKALQTVRHLVVLCAATALLTLVLRDEIVSVSAAAAPAEPLAAPGRCVPTVADLTPPAAP